MKKSNKGFSLVELIIVIAIMAILAGALAPALMKYINKTRLSSDIQTGQTVASAIQAAMSNEEAFNDMNATYSKATYDASGMGSGAFATECEAVLAFDKAEHKAKKDMDNNTLTPGKYYVDIDVADNKIEVYLDDQGDYMVYPTPDPKLSSKSSN